MQENTQVGGEAVAPLPPTAKKKKPTSKLKRREHWTALAFISVKYVGLIISTALPVAFALMYSLSDYYAVRETEPFLSRFPDLFCGFSNYKRLFTDLTYKSYFVTSILNNLIFMFSVPIGILIGLIIAVMLSKEDVIKGSRVFRMLIYIPVVSSAVAMNIIWRYIFDNQYGIFNQIFHTNIYWLTDRNWLRFAIIIKSAWGSIGRTMILCLAALTNVGKDYYEAAELDGAGEFTKFFRISVPLISPTMFYLFTTGFISNLQSYTDSQVFAQGHPGAQTIVYFIWNSGIRESMYGIGSAASVILTLGILVITLVQFKVQNKWVYSE